MLMLKIMQTNMSKSFQKGRLVLYNTKSYEMVPVRYDRVWLEFPCRRPTYEGLETAQARGPVFPDGWRDRNHSASTSFWSRRHQLVAAPHPQAKKRRNAGWQGRSYHSRSEQVCVVNNIGFERVYQPAVCALRRYGSAWRRQFVKCKCTQVQNFWIMMNESDWEGHREDRILYRLLKHMVHINLLLHVFKSNKHYKLVCGLCTTASAGPPRESTCFASRPAGISFAGFACSPRSWTQPTAAVSCSSSGT